MEQVEAHPLLVALFLRLVEAADPVEGLVLVDPAALEAAEAAALTVAVEMVVAMVQMEKAPDIKEEQDKDQPREHSERLTESCVQVAEAAVQVKMLVVLDQTELVRTEMVDMEEIRDLMDQMEQQVW